MGGIFQSLNCIYFFLFAIGVGYALIALLLGQISHIDLPGVDLDIPGVDLHPGEPDIHLEMPFDYDISHDVDHPDVGLSPLSPIILATFITTFGGVGLIVNNLTALNPVVGLLIATVSGVSISGLMFLIYTQVLMAAQGSSEVESGELVGKVGEVIAPIPAGNVGEVAYVVRGSRMTSTARSMDGKMIPRGMSVIIGGTVGSVVIVQPREETAEE